MARLKRILPSLVLDALVALALAFPAAASYLRWPLLGVYALLSVALLRRLSAHRWILTIVNDPATRIAHGLEHATMAVLGEDGLPTRHGFTHGRDRFVIALDAGQGHQHAVVREAAERAIRRVRDGEHSLAYQPGCGTSDVVFAVTLWLVYVSSLLITFVVGGSAAVFFATSVLVFRVWVACETGLGLLAQRLFTVSTAFTSASVCDLRETSGIAGYKRPNHETWFEIVVDVQASASRGGLVSHGPLG